MLRLVSTLLALPAWMLHEVTHAIVALPWARRVAITFDVEDQHPRARIQWQDDETAPKAVSAMAPFIIGSSSMLGLLALWLLKGRPMSGSIEVFAAGTVALMWWIIYTTPSAQDLSYLGDQNE